MLVATSLPNTNCAESLAKATVNILENAFYLAKQKLELSRKAYKQLIQEWGWEKEDKKYLKVAQTFDKFSPLDLAQIEPDTIFLLSKQNKKYAPVIEQLLDIGSITQEKVRELIKQQRKPKVRREYKPTIWRRTENGGRYCQVPPIHDQETGVALQRMMDSEGLTAQKIIAESVALRKAMKEGRLIELSQNQETEDIKVSSLEAIESNESLNNEIYENSLNNESVVEIDNLESLEKYPSYSDSIILNPKTTQGTVESLRDKLFVVVENINYLDKKQVKEAEELVAEIISFCNEQSIGEQWNTLADITQRKNKALMVVIGYSGKEHADWLMNLPQLLANAALINPQELEWVNKRLCTEALQLISNSN